MKILLSSVFVIIADQISKYWIKENYILSSSQKVIGDIFRITYVENPGIAFGIRVGEYLPVITIFSVFAVFLVLYYLYSERESDLMIRLGLALILGGAIGNMIDRFFIILNPDNYTGVVDFIDIGLGSYRWYIFNIADSAVTIGIILIFLHSIVSRKNTASPVV